MNEQHSAGSTDPLDLYYLQDKRSYVGNSMSWWAKDGKGYVCDIRKAHVYTKAEAYAQHAMRETDIPWPKAYIDARISHHIDFQHCTREKKHGPQCICAACEDKRARMTL